MRRRRTALVEGVRLSYLDFGGMGSDALLLHGLAGQASEWETTAHWLRRIRHVISLDQRGHGHSEKSVTDYSRGSYVGDAIHVIEQICHKPVLLIGQSMGGLNAFLLAARRPDLVDAIIVIEASPARNVHAQRDIARWLASWPLPFASLDKAIEFFGGDTLAARTWSHVLERRDAGYWPQFAPENMVASMADLTVCDYWSEWERVSCPTLIVGGDRGSMSEELLNDMAQRVPEGRYVRIAEGGHDVHLDQPQAWQHVAEEFLGDIR